MLIINFGPLATHKPLVY